MIHHWSAAKSMLLVSTFAGLIALLGCPPRGGYIAETPLAIQPDTTKSIDLNEFRAQFANAYRGPLHTHERRAICTHPAPGVGCVARVTIQALGESKDIDPRKPFKEQRVIGQIRNLDLEDITEMYSLKPASQSQYFIMIDGGSNGFPRWNLLEVPVTRFGSIRRIPGKNVTQCVGFPEHQPPPYSDVDFSLCGEHPLASTTYKSGLIDVSGVRSLLLKLASRFRSSSSTIEGGDWMYCPTGCCT